MSNVAAAIENASMEKVDAELWWDSHVGLFQLLDESIDRAASRSVEDNDESASEGDAQLALNRDGILAEQLEVNHNWLLNTLTYFKPPSATSRAALMSSKVAVGNHILEIDSSFRDLALQVSNILMLDEIQAYILTSKVSETKPILSPFADSTNLSAIVMSYYMERQSVLKSIRLMLTCQMADKDTDARLLQEISEEVKKLLDHGLEDKMVEGLKESLSSVQPQHLDRDHGDLWAEEAALEQTLLLDILFLLYYEPLCVCEYTRLMELMNMFEDIIIWRPKGEILALTPETEKSLKHARRQAVLIIIEALDLEGLLVMLYSDTPFNQGIHALTMENLHQLDGVMSGLEMERAPECGPVLLSWATFLCLVSYLPHSGETAVMDKDHSRYARLAYESGACSYLLDMLQDGVFQEHDIQVGGYKSVIKTLLSAFLAAYDSAGQMVVDGHDVLIDILCEIYRGQETLCLELWDREIVIDGPIRNLLYSLRDSFPYETLSLVRLLAAQCEGTWSAECVYDFLQKMVEITSLYQRDELSLIDETGTMVQTRTTLQVPDAPGLLIPAGTTGCILRDLSGGVCLVRWECKHSGLVVLLLRMLQRSISGYQMDEVLAILDLINCMLSSNKGLIQLLLDLDGSSATTISRVDGRMESSLRLDVVSMICSVINSAVQTTGDNIMVAFCVGILSSFAQCCPEQVMTELAQSVLFQPSGSYLNFRDGRPFPGNQLHDLIVKTEQSIGHYPLTIAVLNFSRTMLEKGMAVHAVSFTALIMHIIGNWFVNHGNWKYQQWHERWMITTKVIWIMRSIVTNIMRTKDISPLKGALELLLYDYCVQDVLIDVLSTNAQELEELHFNRSVSIKELEWLQQAIYSLLMLLHDLVLDVTNGVCSKEYAGATLLEQTLCRKAAGSLPVVTAITSFLTFSRNGDLQLASAKALTSLLLMGQKSRSHTTDIASYITSNEQKGTVRMAITHLLSEDIAFSNSLLFEAIIDFLTAAVKWQPALVEHLLFPMEQSMVNPSASEQGLDTVPDTNGTTIPTTMSATEGLDALWEFVANSATVGKSYPQVLSRVLFLFASIWEAGIDYLLLIEALRGRTHFWKHLTSCLSFCNGPNTTSQTLLSKIKAFQDPGIPVPSGLNNSNLVAFSFLYTCEASVLSIMARDIYLQEHLIHVGISDRTVAGSVDLGADRKDSSRGKNTNTTIKLKHVPGISGALQVILEWLKSSQLSGIMSSYALCLYDREALLHTKAEARVLMVGLISKILAGDNRGLNISLTRRVQEAARQICQHPSFEELSEQYSTRRYSYGEQLPIMLMNDLFHHLQGELDGGRPIPSGPFKHVTDYLVTNEVDTLLIPIVSNQLPDVHPSYGDAFMYDANTLETELGLEWSGHAEFDAVKVLVSERTLKCIRQSNAIASLGHSQLSALRSWSALLTVSVFNKREAEGGMTFAPAEWPETMLTSYSSELCLALEGMLTAIGPIVDVTNFTPSFMMSQVQLLLVFIRWICSLGSLSLRKVYVWSICTKLIHTIFGCLKKLLDAHSFGHHQNKELVKSFLGALLELLELTQSQKNPSDEKQGFGQASDLDMGDVFADITLSALGFLPSLCHAVEKPEYASVAIAVINVLIKSFLAPSTWFPILQNHFPLAASLSRMQNDGQDFDSSKVMLNFCLSFVRLKGGAELLHSGGVFSQLQILNHNLEDMPFPSADMEGPFSVWWKHGKLHGGLWSLGVAVVAGLVRSLGDQDPTGRVIQHAVTYIQLEKERMVGALRAPMTAMDLQGRRKVKLQRPRTTLMALQDSQHVIALLCEVSHHHIPWALKDSISDFGEVIVHLLAFIAREGLVHPGSNIRSGTGAGFSCQPLHKDEIIAHARAPVINSCCAWFAVTARGCLVEEGAPSARSQSPSRSASISLTLSPSRRSSSFSSSPTSSGSGVTAGIRPSEYSNSVAIQIYRLCFLLVKYLCQQAQHAIRRVAEGGPPEFSELPGLPAPEILHGLQDQVVAIVTEICGKTMDKANQDLCVLLLSILEMTLHLEICIAKTCGVGPLPLRSDDFGKEYKAMLIAGYTHAFLETSLLSSKRIMSAAYPGLV